MRRIDVQPMPPIDTYVYRISSTRRSSAELGDCSLCDKWVPDVHYQIEGIVFGMTSDEGGNAVTHLGCKNHFGHRDCLLAIRRQPNVERNRR